MGLPLTPEGRLSFPHLFQPQPARKPGDKLYYNCVLLFPKTADLSVLKEAAKKAAEERWPDPAKRPKLRSPFRDGDEKQLDGYAGHIYVSFKSERAPRVVDENVVEVIDPKKIYPGCYARVSFTCYAYDQDGNRGVGFGLGNVQFLRDGKPFGNASNPEDDFGVVAEQQAAAPASRTAPSAAGGNDLDF